MISPLKFRVDSSHVLPDRKYFARIGGRRRNRDARGPPGDLIKFIRRQWAVIFERSGLALGEALRLGSIEPGGFSIGLGGPGLCSRIAAGPPFSAGGTVRWEPLACDIGQGLAYSGLSTAEPLTSIRPASVLRWTIAPTGQIADGSGTYLFRHAVKFALDLFLCEEIPPWRVIECDAQCSAKSCGRE